MKLIILIAQIIRLIYRHATVLMGLVFLFHTTLYSQKSGEISATGTVPAVPVNLKLMARSYGDSVVLRWSLMDAAHWNDVFNQGFIVEKLELDDATNEPISGKFEPLSHMPIRPFSASALSTPNARRDTFLSMAYACLYNEIRDTLKRVENDNAFYQRIMRQKQAHENRFMMANLVAAYSPAAANALAMRFVDTHVEKNKKYFYRIRVSPLNQTPGFTSDTAFALVKPAHIFKVSPPQAPETVSADSLISLRWPKSEDFFAWHVFRSTDDKTYERLTAMPYLQVYTGVEGNKNEVVYINKIEKNYKPYWYKIQGLDFFGEWSTVSYGVKAYGIDLTPPPAPFITELLNPNNGVKISWLVPDPSQVSSQKIMYSEQYEGPYDTLATLDAAKREYLDTKANIYGTNFYVVVSVDEHGNQSHSMPKYAEILNREPPSKPTGLVGTIDTNGVVRISWNRNPDKDLQGYNVFASNYLNDTYVPVSNMIADTFFVDTITLKTTLNEAIYYEVRAIDYGYKVGEYSEPLALKRPDLVPPVSPVLTRFTVTDSSIVLFWNYSTSSDVKSQIIYRKKDGEPWAVLKTVGKTDSVFIDNKVIPDQMYEYKLTALDDDGLVSEPSQTLRLKPYDSETNKYIYNLIAKYNVDTKKVELKWNYRSVQNETRNLKFLVWRATEGDNLLKYSTTSDSQLSFSDDKINAGKQYKYAVQAIESDGDKSLISPAVSIKIE